ncbi:MAG: GPR endopeptidase [Bacillota bacterium]|jgi:spore protease|nr:GPR endopeptidase [Bacillota bacterium]HHU43193.1 GPR endopeptidase [Clostridiales bacterium]
MERVYREFFEATLLKKQDYTEEVESYYNDLIIMRKGVRKDFGKDSMVYTAELKHSIFGKREMQNALSDILAGALIEVLKRNKYRRGKRTLAVGLGNEKMTADSLGSKTVDGLQVSRHFLNEGSLLKGDMANLSAIKSSVSGVTGLNSYDIIRGVIATTKPDFLIAIDTLASKSLSRIARAVQITDYGIEPGKGVNNSKTILSESTLGIPVIAIGAPFVIYVMDIIREYIINNGGQVKDISELKSYVVTAKDIDISVEEYGYVLSRAINIALNTA